MKTFMHSSFAACDTSMNWYYSCRFVFYNRWCGLFRCFWERKRERERERKKERERASRWLVVSMWLLLYIDYYGDPVRCMLDIHVVTGWCGASQVCARVRRAWLPVLDHVLRESFNFFVVFLYFFFYLRCFIYLSVYLSIYMYIYIYLFFITLVCCRSSSSVYVGIHFHFYRIMPTNVACLSRYVI